MLRKCERGFSLLEVLVSFSVWLLLFTTLIPSFVLVKQERANILFVNTANQLIFEELMAIKNNSGVKENKTVSRNGISYTLEWSAVDETKVCVRWEDKRKRPEERCGYTNQ
ncbi:type II secretion system protein [Bacillus luteolus]|uniref:Type II secretion system protein n=1 Tax=Litchfieldia luteola TaxID=682179 RepID=A0ABR9QID9_9BACI|nr:type II secretion system protein [Cytobacillus luteolus]MBE4907949.1 type II secretion system protein [Cytobacillus luteolus]MBP1942728.1 type II secretory pathway pseudopilin PulG [Cytobacillus luteolus]